MKGNSVWFGLGLGCESGLGKGQACFEGFGTTTTQRSGSTSEVQTINLSNLSSGTFRLIFVGQVTASIVVVGIVKHTQFDPPEIINYQPLDIGWLASLFYFRNAS